MFNQVIAALILCVAADVGVPPYFALAVALEENKMLNPLIVSAINDNGSVDLGVMQLNSEYFGHIAWYDPETNIRAGCLLLKGLMGMREINTYWAVAVSYNCGYQRFISSSGAPASSLDYAARVMARWYELEGGRYINPVIIKDYW